MIDLLCVERQIPQLHYLINIFALDFKVSRGTL